jgi:hypothetical protein
MGLPLSLFIFMRFLIWLSTLHLVFTLSSPFMQPLCHHDDSSALLQFKKSFIINEFASLYPSNCQKVASWTLEGDKSDCCSWDGVECDEHTGHVIGLNLSSSCLFGSINSNSSLFRLVHLQRLDLSYNDFNGSHIPSQVRDLSRLIDLDLNWSNFSGQIPSEISQLSHLSSLDLSRNSGLELKKLSLRSLIGNMTCIQKLDLSGVNISSTVPNILANLSSLTHLGLESCGLHGEFPKGTFMLPNLRSFEVEFNDGLTGYLPGFTWSSPLETLNLGHTSFSGELPAFTRNFSFLTSLSMQVCNLSGSIPSSLGNLTKLTLLNLRYNAFVGNVPSSFKNLVQLYFLDISHNRLTGPIPFKVIGLPQLWCVSLSYNLLHGKMDLDQLMNGTRLALLNLSNNRLSGPILTFGPTTLKYLVLSKNFFISFGQHPTFLRWTHLQVLDLSSNLINGSLPILPNNISHFYISNNSLTGNIPESFCNLSFLKVLDLGSNNLSGSLPRCLDNFGDSLKILDLQINRFEGSIPKNWIKGGQLSIIKFTQNKFQGHLPISLAKCTMLKVLDLSYNQFNGRFPFWLGCLPNLEILILRSNKFNGTMEIAQTHFKFPKM